MAARQVQPLIDLRTQQERQGVGRKEQQVQFFANLLKITGQAEKVRQERGKLDRITRAIANGATTQQAILEAAREPVGADPGFRGLLQNIGGAFKPQGGGGIEQNIQQAIIGQALQQALAPKPLLSRPEQEKGARIKAGLEPKATTTKPFQQTPAEKALDRDVKILTAKDKQGNVKANETQKKLARSRLRQNPNLRETTGGSSIAIAPSETGSKVETSVAPSMTGSNIAVAPSFNGSKAIIFL